MMRSGCLLTALVLVIVSFWAAVPPARAACDVPPLDEPALIANFPPRPWFYMAMEPEMQIAADLAEASSAAAGCPDGRGFVRLAQAVRNCQSRAAVGALLISCAGAVGEAKLDTPLAVIEAGLARFPEDPLLLGYRLHVLRLDRLPRLGPALRDTLTSRPQDAYVLFEVAEGFLALKDTDAALTWAREAHRVAPAGLLSATALFDVLVAQKQTDEAARTVEELVAQWEKRPVMDVAPNGGADLCAGAANLLLARHQVERGARLYLDCLRMMRPGANQDWMLKRARVLLRERVGGRVRTVLRKNMLAAPDLSARDRELVEQLFR